MSLHGNHRYGAWKVVVEDVEDVYTMSTTSHPPNH